MMMDGRHEPPSIWNIPNCVPPRPRSVADFAEGVNYGLEGQLKLPTTAGVSLAFHEYEVILFFQSLSIPLRSAH